MFPKQWDLDRYVMSKECMRQINMDSYRRLDPLPVPFVGEHLNIRVLTLCCYILCGYYSLYSIVCVHTGQSTFWRMLCIRPYSRCQSLKTSLVFLNRASYGRRRNNDVTSQEREVKMMLRHNFRRY